MVPPSVLGRRRYPSEPIPGLTPRPPEQARASDVGRATGARELDPQLDRSDRHVVPLSVPPEKNSSAVLVFVCCSPERSTPLLSRNALASAATWNASSGRALVDSSTICDPSGYIHSSPTSFRPKPSGVTLTLMIGIGPKVESESSSTPSGACASKNARCCFEKSFRI